jgi:hypothetical protein
MKGNPKENKKRYLAEIVGGKYGKTTRYVYRAAEYYRAVEILANEFGDDIRDLILNHHVRLTHAQVIRFAGIVQRAPGAFRLMGNVIRAGNTKMVKGFISGDL